MEQESQLDLLANQVREAEAKRRAVEEKFSRTPNWRFRRRTNLLRRIERRRQQESDLKDLIWKVAQEADRPAPR